MIRDSIFSLRAGVLNLPFDGAFAMKPFVLNLMFLLLLGIAVALVLVGCELLEETATPIFADTELMDASYSAGQFRFFPSWDVEYVVLGIFQNPIVTLGKRIVNMNDMKGGSCTGLSGFTRSQVDEVSLFIYSDASGYFTGLPGGFNPNGTMYWAVWGFNADWVIISSSEMITTNFP
jgi:hypothetical protein